MTRDTQLQQPDLFLSKLFTAILKSHNESTHLLGTFFEQDPVYLKHWTIAENKQVGAIILLSKQTILEFTTTLYEEILRSEESLWWLVNLASRELNLTSCGLSLAWPFPCGQNDGQNAFLQLRWWGVKTGTN